MNHGECPRYNSRDTVWWFIRSVGDYIQFSGDHDILKQTVNMKFLSDDEGEHKKKSEAGESKTMTLENIIQEIMSKHTTGIRFREWQAGNKLDDAMKYEGFNIDLKLDEFTGFVVGGNLANCLTWMDRVGTSEKARNNGHPAASR